MWKHPYIWINTKQTSELICYNEEWYNFFLSLIKKRLNGFTVSNLSMRFSKLDTNSFQDKHRWSASLSICLHYEGNLFGRNPNRSALHSFFYDNHCLQIFISKRNLNQIQALALQQCYSKCKEQLPSINCQQSAIS